MSLPDYVNDKIQNCVMADQKIRDSLLNHAYGGDVDLRYLLTREFLLILQN